MLEKIIPDNFNGAIYVSKDSEIVIDQGYGQRDLVNKIANQKDTIFGTASVGKVFVAVGLMQLVESGELSLDAKFRDYFPNELKNVDREVTIEQLLSHTSGIGDYFDEDTMEYPELWEDFPNYKIRKNDDLLLLFKNKEMESTPGEKFKYNNMGYVLLAKLLEKITGKLFDDYLKEKVFTVAGMSKTGYYACQETLQRHMFRRKQRIVTIVIFIVLMQREQELVDVSQLLEIF